MIQETDNLVEEQALQSVIADKVGRLVQLQKLQKSWLQQHRIYFYRPKGNQPAFHSSLAHVRLAFGTNRSGKTTAGVVEDIAFALGFRPWLLPERWKQLPISELIARYH